LARPGDVTLLEQALPVRELSLVIDADRRAADPVYAAHRWWARRPPALMRALLLAAALPADCSPAAFWAAYAQPEQLLAGLRVHDPFVGGGSTLVEAARLGATASGSDVDPLAVEIVRHELSPAPAEDVRAAGDALLAHLRELDSTLYPDQRGAVPLHYFWLHEVICPSCGASGLLYRDLVLARDRRKAGAVVRDHALTVFCPADLTLHHLKYADRKELWHCGRRFRLDAGTFRAGKYTCPQCGRRSTHRDLQTGVVERRLVAVEETVAGARRRLRAPTNADAAALAAAGLLLGDTVRLALPQGTLRADRQDPRPLSYGMDTAAKLFSDRQLVVLGTAMRWLQDADLGPGVRRAVTLALSNALATNNKLCGYAVDYGRLSALFSVRGYPLPALAVELNPLHPDGGRGTIRHCIERVARSATPTVRRYAWSVDAAATRAVDLQFPSSSVQPSVVCASADQDPGTSPEVADLCVFDPPYFGYIAYSELSEFYRCWVASPEPAGTPLLPRGEDPAERFGLDFAACLRATLRRLAPGRPIAFTYHSADPDAWRAIGVALDDAKLAVTGLWPVRSDGHMGHHSHPGNCEWDLVVVCRRLAETRPAPLKASIDDWVTAADPLTVSATDQASMQLAVATAAPRFAAPAVPDPQGEADLCTPTNASS
jgi:adenine-specific DNA methylase